MMDFDIWSLETYTEYAFRRQRDASKDKGCSETMLIQPMPKWFSLVEKRQLSRV